MKSGKQRRLEIKEKRRKKAVNNISVDVYSNPAKLPKGAIKSNLSKIYVNHYVTLPTFYIDKAYVCRDCGSEEVWTAKQQKWWFEIIKGDVNSTAIRCLRCRKVIRDQKAEQKAHMEEMANAVPHPNEAFFKKRKR